MDASGTTLPSAQPWHSQTLEPSTPVTDTLPNDDAQIQPHRTPTEIAVHRLPTEIWIAVCEALRRLDLIDITIPQDSGKKVYPELQRTTANQNRPDPIVTAVSIVHLSQTCRYLYKVTSPSMLETIRLRPPSGERGETHYLPVIKQVMSLQLNNNQRLRHVRGFAVALPDMNNVNTDHRNDLRNQICHLLPRFPNLRHLTVIGMTLDIPLMHTILTLPLEHLWLWDVVPENPIADHNFTPTTTPRINLRSLVLREESLNSFPSIPIEWVRPLIGTAIQDLLIDANGLRASVLPVLQDLEFLEVTTNFRTHGIKPSMLCRLLSITPNLKEAVVETKAARGDPADTIPALSHLSHLERVTCHASWLPLLIPGRPITTARVSCDSQVRMQELFEILHQSSVPLLDLTLHYLFETLQPIWSPYILHQTWSPDDLEHVARYTPELEFLSLEIVDHKTDGLHKALFYISQLEKLRLVSFSFWSPQHEHHISGLLDDVWQESILREFLGLTRSPVLESVSFVGEFEWKSEDTKVWILWQGGRMVRSVSL